MISSLKTKVRTTEDGTLRNVLSIDLENRKSAQSPCLEKTKREKKRWQKDALCTVIQETSFDEEYYQIDDSAVVLNCEIRCGDHYEEDLLASHLIGWDTGATAAAASFSAFDQVIFL